MRLQKTVLRWRLPAQQRFQIPPPIQNHLLASARCGSRRERNCRSPTCPNSLALTKAPIKDVVRVDIGFSPVAFGLRLVTTFDEKTANVIIAITADNAVRKRQVKLHPVTFPRLVVVKTNPRPGRIKLVAHKAV